MRKTALVVMIVLFAGVAILGCTSNTPAVVPLSGEAGSDIYAELIEMTEVETASPSVSSSNDNESQSGGMVRWEYAGNSWVPSSAPPECPPLAFASPVDVSKATSILYPGQYRGSDYKPHGGFRFDGSGNDIEVSAPFDGHVVDGVRYVENGEVQYMFDFLNECGVMYRFDHLLGLSAQLQALAETLPEPRKDDTRTTMTEPLLFKKGDMLAAKVGATGNVFFDWGVYDLRKENNASKNPSYRVEHEDEKHHAFHGICWLDYLPEPERTHVKALPGSGSEGRKSDYC